MKPKPKRKAGPGRPKGRFSAKDQAAVRRTAMKRTMAAAVTGRRNTPTLPLSEESEKAAMRRYNEVVDAKVAAATAKAQRELKKMEVETGDLIPKVEVTDYVTRYNEELRREVDKFPEYIRKLQDCTAEAEAYLTHLLGQIADMIRKRMAEFPPFIAQAMRDDKAT